MRGSGLDEVMPPADIDRQSSTRRHDRRRAFEQEVTRLMDRLYGTALRLTRNRDEAEDIVAEAVGKAWHKLDDLRDIERLEGWLFQILNNTFVSAWRRKQSRKEHEADTDVTEHETSDAIDFSIFRELHQPFLLWWGTPEQRFLNDLLHEDIQRALDSLPDAFRVVVVLVEVEGYTYEEAAALLEVPLGTVRSRLNRGRGLLQKALWEQAREAGLVERGSRGGDVAHTGDHQ